MESLEAHWEKHVLGLFWPLNKLANKNNLAMQRTVQEYQLKVVDFSISGIPLSYKQFQYI